MTKRESALVRFVFVAGLLVAAFQTFVPFPTEHITYENEPSYEMQERWSEIAAEYQARRDLSELEAQLEIERIKLDTANRLMEIELGLPQPERN